MVSRRRWSVTPKQLRLLFFTTTALLCLVLVWLGWSLLQQDEQVAAERLTERRESAANRAAATLEQQLAQTVRDLDVLSATGVAPILSLSDAAVFVRLDGATVTASPRSHLLYSPVMSMPAPTAADPPLVQAARAMLSAGRNREALDDYARFESLGSTLVANMPAALAGELGTLAVYERLGDRDRALSTARTIDRGLTEARWVISSATFQFVSNETSRWLPAAERRPQQAIGLTDAVGQVWTDVTSARSPGATLAIYQTPTGPLLTIWRRSGPVVSIFAAAPSFIEQQWIAPLGLDVSLLDPDGQPFLTGLEHPHEHPAIRLASTARLPWTLQAYVGDDSYELASQRSQHRILAAGFAVLLLVVVVCGSFVAHSVARELAVARLQANFVSAVSHEFRTPLTSLCQLSELLMRNRVEADEDRRTYYALLYRESDRLRRLVEKVLDFGRLQSGRLPLHIAQVDVKALVETITRDFAEGPAALGHRIELSLPREATFVRADAQALQCVLSNLLENGAKYSPDAPTLWVTLSVTGSHLELAVRDEGVGIPPNEQRRVFEQFVRGSNAEAFQVRGTGIGLTMARELVRAHDGEISVHSVPGRGSTFVVLLPIDDVSHEGAPL